MSKKSKKHKSPATPKPVTAPKIARANFPATTRAKRSWKERQLLRATRAAGLLDRLENSIANGKPPGIDVMSVTHACGHLAIVVPLLNALPDDFVPNKSYRSAGSGIGIGSLIGVKTEMETDPVFKHISAAVFEKASVIDHDGKQNWLVQCTDGQARTIRKKFVELVSDEEIVPEDAPEELLDDSDDDSE